MKDYGIYTEHIKAAQEVGLVGTAELLINLSVAINRKNSELIKFAERLDSGRSFLMQVQPDELSVEDALEAFGFSRNGI